MTTLHAIAAHETLQRSIADNPLRTPRAPRTFWMQPFQDPSPAEIVIKKYRNSLTANVSRTEGWRSRATAGSVVMFCSIINQFHFSKPFNISKVAKIRGSATRKTLRL